MARREKKPVHKVVMTEGKRNIIQQLLQEYDIETAEDIQDALKDLLDGHGAPGRRRGVLRAHRRGRVA